MAIQRRNGNGRNTPRRLGLDAGVGQNQTQRRSVLESAPAHARRRVVPCAYCTLVPCPGSLMSCLSHSRSTCWHRPPEHGAPRWPLGVLRCLSAFHFQGRNPTRQPPSPPLASGIGYRIWYQVSTTSSINRQPGVLAWPWHQDQEQTQTRHHLGPET
jgi:hypothetical protein